MQPVVLPRLDVRTSLRAVFREWGWSLAFGLPVAAGLLVLDGDPLAEVLPIITVIGAIMGGVLVLAYILFGMAEVAVDDAGIRARTRSGRSFAVGWDDLAEVWLDQSWRLRTRDDDLYRIRELGFAPEDWDALSMRIFAFQATAPTDLLPGVLTPPAKHEHGPDGPPVEAIYQAQHGAALWWGGPFFLVCLGVGLAASVPRWLDGTWAEEPGLTVFVPFFSAVFVGLFVFSLGRLVRRATFLPEAVLVERYLLKPVLVPYGALTDGFGQTLSTTQGQFVLGNRNSEAFWRLLDPHLQPEQLSGDAFVSEVRGLRALGYAMVLLIPCIVLLYALDRWLFDLPPGWGELYYALGPFALALALGYAAAWLRLRWLLAHSDDDLTPDDA